MNQKNMYFIQSSDCRAVKGYSRSIIIDYSRNEIYFISNEYYSLLEKLNRQILDEVEKLIDLDSRDDFNDFLLFLLDNEIGFLADSLLNFPVISLEYDDPSVIENSILEVDINTFDEKKIVKIVNSLKELGCRELQIRLISDIDFDFLDIFFELLRGGNFDYIELHVSKNKLFEVKSIFNLIDKVPQLSFVYVYGCENFEIVEYFKETIGFHPILLGKVFLLDYVFDNGNCCGNITKENLDFSNITNFNFLKKNNGCLSKKITFDKFGNIKNCPSMKKTFGNILDVKFDKVINNEMFKELWNITKDEISVCKNCEFRYNCTDCRSFLIDYNDIYSKPLKCGYNPITCEWEDWSLNPLKEL